MSSPTRRAVLRGGILASITAVSGCSLAAGPTTTDAETVSATRSSGVSPIRSIATPDTTDSGTATTRPGNTGSFDGLSAEGKRIFESLLEDGSIERGTDRIPRGFETTGRVSYEGSVYRVLVSDTGRYVGEYGIDVSPTSESRVEDDGFVEYEALNAEARSIFDTAVSGGEAEIRDRELSKQIGSPSYVQYEEEFYRWEVTVGDIPVLRLSLEKIET